MIFFSNKQATKLKEEDVENTVWTYTVKNDSFLGDFTQFIYFKSSGEGEIKGYFDKQVEDNIEINIKKFVWKIVDNKYIEISCNKCGYDDDKFIIKNNISLVNYDTGTELFERSSLGSYNKVK